jgi:hypothetical protein
MLGYDLYSSALADILSEPSLSMPITVGLYAKWGSGKSFLLNKLRGMYVRLACSIYIMISETNINTWHFSFSKANAGSLIMQILSH